MKNLTVSKSFSNLEELRRYLDNGMNNFVFNSSYDRHSHDTGDFNEKFTGTPNWDAAAALLRDGDEDNARKLKAAAGGTLKAASGDGTRTRRYSHVCGGAVSVPAMLMGLPKSMIAQKKITYKDSKVLSLVYNASISCNISADEINKVSAYLVNAILGLEKKGYRVNLYVGIATYRSEFISRTKTNRETCAMFVRIKDSGQYMDVKKMAYPLVNPSMLRRHFFRFVEVAPGLTNYKWPGTYGTPIRDRDEMQPLADAAGVHARKIVSFYDIQKMTAPEIMTFLLS